MKLLLYQCCKCQAYTDHLIDDKCVSCHWRPWTWDDYKSMKKKRMETASW